MALDRTPENAAFAHLLNNEFSTPEEKADFESGVKARVAAVEEDLARDIAWAEFAEGRIENPTSEPVSWGEAQRQRA